MERTLVASPTAVKYPDPAARRQPIARTAGQLEQGLLEEAGQETTRVTTAAVVGAAEQLMEPSAAADARTSSPVTDAPRVGPKQAQTHRFQLKLPRKSKPGRTLLLSVSPALVQRELQKTQRSGGPASSATPSLKPHVSTAAASSAPTQREPEGPPVMAKKRKLVAEPLLVGRRRSTDSTPWAGQLPTSEKALAVCGSLQHVAEVRCKYGEQLDDDCPANWSRALHWCRRAAALGDAHAMRVLSGGCCLHGAGVAANAGHAAIDLQRAQGCGDWRKPW